MQTGFERVDKAKEFGLPYVVLRRPRPYDTTTLNYNWQIWDTNAFSLYSTTTSQIDRESARQLIDSVLRFMAQEDIIDASVSGGYLSEVLSSESMLSLRPEHAGIFQCEISAGQFIQKGQVLARILDVMEGGILEELIAPCDGIVFFVHNEPLTYANTAVLKLIPRHWHPLPGL